jgi:hypothetical protein
VLELPSRIEIIGQLDLVDLLAVRRPDPGLQHEP